MPREIFLKECESVVGYSQMSGTRNTSRSSSQRREQRVLVHRQCRPHLVVQPVFGTTTRNTLNDTLRRRLLGKQNMTEKM